MPDVELRIIGKNLSKQALAQLKRDVENTTKAFEEATGATVDLGKESQDTKADLTGLAVGFGAVAAASGLAIKSFIGAAVKMEKMKKGLVAVAGGAAEAEKQLKSMREVAKLPGLGLEEAIQGSISLQAVGFSAKQAEDALMAFGNALATVGKGRAELAGVLLALTQMRAKGKVLAEEINQIAERVPQIRAVMMEAFGTGASEDIQKMGVTAEQFIKIVITELGKLPGVSGGAANAIENLGDEVFQLKVSLGDILLPTFAKVLGVIASLVEWMNKLSDTQKAVISWSLLATTAITGLTAAALGLAMAWPKITAGITTLGKAMIWLSAHPVVLAAAGITALVTVLAIYIKKTRDAKKATRDAWKAALGDITKLSKKEIEIHLRSARARRQEVKGELISARMAASTSKNRISWWKARGKSVKKVEANYLRFRKEVRELEKEFGDLESTITKAEEAMVALAKPKGPPLGPHPYKPSGAEIKLERELEKARIERIENTYQRERELARKEARWKIEDLQTELASVKKVGLSKNKEALILRAIESTNADLRHQMAEIDSKEAEELADAQEQATAQRREWIEEEGKLAEERAEKELEVIEKVQQAYQTTVAARFETERLRIGQIENSYERERQSAYLNWRSRVWQVQQIMMDEETSAEVRQALMEQEQELWRAYQTERTNIDKKEADNAEKTAKERSQAIMTYFQSIAETWIKVWEDAGKAREAELTRVAQIEVANERVRISLIDDKATREKATAKLRYDLAKASIEKEMELEEASAERKIALQEQLFLVRQQYGERIREIEEDAADKWSYDYGAAMEDMYGNMAYAASDFFSGMITNIDSLDAAWFSFLSNMKSAFVRTLADMAAAHVMQGLKRAIAGIALGGATGGMSAFAAPAMAAIPAMFSFDRPSNDALARWYGARTALMGASYDNPVNDLRARLVGTRTASYDMGRRSADDMLGEFTRGYKEQSKRTGGGDSRLLTVLQQLSEQMADTPELVVHLDGRELHSAVERMSDKKTFRKDGY